MEQGHRSWKPEGWNSRRTSWQDNAALSQSWAQAYQMAVRGGQAGDISLQSHKEEAEQSTLLKLALFDASLSFWKSYPHTDTEHNNPCSRGRNRSYERVGKEQGKGYSTLYLEHKSSWCRWWVMQNQGEYWEEVHTEVGFSPEDIVLSLYLFRAPGRRSEERKMRHAEKKEERTIHYI